MGPNPAPEISDLVSHEELKKHNRKEDCWIVIHSKVYNVSSFLAEHPGGAASRRFARLGLLLHNLTCQQ